jgi:hypothetical protein
LFQKKEEEEKNPKQPRDKFTVQDFLDKDKGKEEAELKKRQQLEQEEQLRQLKGKELMNK